MRRYLPEDREALRRFQTRFFGGEKARQLEEARSRWLFEANPWTEGAGPEIWLCVREEIVGQQSGIVHRLKVGSDVLRASWAIDLMVDPAWRMRGVGPALMERHARSHPVVIGVGATDQAYASLLRSGWADVGTIPSCMRPLRLSELRHWRERRPARAKLARLVVPPLGWMADRWGDVAARRTRVRLEAVPSFDERIDAVWRLAAAELSVTAIRDAAALSWRFDASPDAPRYRRFLLVSDNAAVGYFVLRDGDLYGDRVSHLVDYLCPLRLMDALLAQVNEVCQATGVGAVVCNALDLRATRAFKRAGFLPYEGPARHLLWRTQAHLEGLHSILSDPRRWFVTQADSDADHPPIELLRPTS